MLFIGKSRCQNPALAFDFAHLPFGKFAKWIEIYRVVSAYSTHSRMEGRIFGWPVDLDGLIPLPELLLCSG